MFSKIAIVFANFAIMVAASPIAEKGIIGSCNTGDMYCCDSVQDADAGLQSVLAGIAGAAVGPITGQVGLTCSSINSLGGVSVNSCSSQPTCCQSNNFNGLFALGCSPINA